MKYCRNCSKRMGADHPRIEMRTTDGINMIFCSITCYHNEEQGKVGGTSDRRLFDDLETRLGVRAVEEGKV